MTQLHEQIKEHLREIRSLSTRGKYWSVDYVVGKIEEETDALLKLVGISPRSLIKGTSAFELWLTDECNDLGQEIVSLRNDLTDMTLNYNAAEKHVKSLQADLDVATKGNAFLRERLFLAERQVARDNECLRKRWDKIKVLETELDAIKELLQEKKDRPAEQARRVKYLEQARSADEAYIQRLIKEIASLKHDLARREGYTKARQEHIKILNRDFDAVTQGNTELLEENKKLNREYALQKQYVKILERETRNYTRRLTWWSKLQVKK